MRLVRALLIVLPVLVAPALDGCASVPAAAHASGAVRIRYAEPKKELGADDDDRVVTEHREAAARVRRAVVEDLVRAGYDVATDGPYDLAMEITVAVRTRPHEDAEVRDVMIVFRDAAGEVVDRVRFEAAEGAPAKKPERVAGSLVKAVVDSKAIDRRPLRAKQASAAK